MSNELEVALASMLSAFDNFMASKWIVDDQNRREVVHPLRGSVDFITTSQSSENLISDAFIRYFEDLFATPTANPNDKQRIIDVELLHSASLTAVDPNTVQSTNKNEIAESIFSASTRRTPNNSERELLTLIRKKRFIAFVGDRGIGKTHFINRFLHSFTHEVLNNLPIYWFRIDAAKVARIIEKANKTNASTYGRLYRDKLYYYYFRIHTAYVFLFYAGVTGLEKKKDPLFSSTLAALRESKGRYNRSSPSEFDELVKVLTARYKAVRARLVDSADVSEELILELFGGATSELDDALFTRMDIFFEELFKYFMNNEKDCLAIVDGADNISWDRNSRFYLTICNSLQDFISEIQRLEVLRKTKLLLVARPELLPMIQGSFSNISHDKPPSDDLAYLEYKHVDMRAASLTKIRAGGNPLVKPAARKNYVARAKSLRSEIGSHVGFDEDDDISIARWMRGAGVLDGIFRHSNSFLRDLDEIVSELLGRIPERSREFWLGHDKVDIGSQEYVYNYNTRAYLRSIVRSWRLSSESERIRISGARDRRRILEYLILEGRFFRRSDRSPKEGRAHQSHDQQGIFPNIFWYDSKLVDGDRSHWHALAGYRILSLTRRHPERTVNKIIEITADVFGHEKKILEEIVKAFVAFGLLAVGELTVADYVGSDKEVEEPAPTLTITGKGRLCVLLSLYCFDWLNFLALDTPFHANVVGGRKKYLRFHRNPEAPEIVNQDYVYSAVINVATFLSYCKQFQNYELSEYFNMKGFLKHSAMLGRIDAFKSDTKLPSSWWRFSREEVERIMRARMRNIIEAQGDQRRADEVQFVRFCSEFVTLVG